MSLHIIQHSIRESILCHSSAGQYGYGTAKPYAFSELLSTSAFVPQREQHIAFNAMQTASFVLSKTKMAT